ncbi:MAG: peptidase MA family metallohydrolase, partial [Chloroflexota bacterium]
RGQLNKAELRVVYGKNPKENTITTQFAEGSSTEARAEILTQDAPLAAGMTVSYYWILGNSSGDNIRTDTKTVIYEDTRFSWRQRSGPAVTVRWYSGDEAYGNLMYTLANDALATYKRRFSINPYEHIYISIYGSSKEYLQASPDVPSWSGGYALAERNEILAIAPQQHRLSNVLIGEGIPHELSHVVLYQHLGHKHAPRWLDEGLAVYNQNVIAPEYDDIVKNAYRQNQLLTLASLNHDFPSDGETAKLAYAQSRSLVTFFINNYGDAVWSNLLDQLRYGDIDQAMEKVFGVKLATMEEEWHNSLGGKKLNLPAALLKGQVSEVPPANNLLDSTNPVLVVGLGVAVILVFGLALFLIGKKPKEPRQPHKNTPLDKNDLNPPSTAYAPYPASMNVAATTQTTDQRGLSEPYAPYPTSMNVALAPYQASNPPINTYLPDAPDPYANSSVNMGFATNQSNAEADPFDIIAATFGQKTSAPPSPYPYSPPPSVGDNPSPAASYYPPNTSLQPSIPTDPYGLNH